MAIDPLDLSEAFHRLYTRLEGQEKKLARIMEDLSVLLETSEGREVLAQRSRDYLMQEMRERLFLASIMPLWRYEVDLDGVSPAAIEALTGV